MNILICGNEKVFDGMLIACLSLVRHTTQPIDFYILTMDLTQLNSDFKPINSSQKDVLEQVLKSKNNLSQVHLIDATQLYLEKMGTSPNNQTSYTPYSFLRLLADKIETLPDKILYIDTDVVFNSDPSELYNINIENFEFGGVPDYYGRFFYNKNYINTGVLLLNLNEIRKTGLFEKTLWLCREKKIFLADQTALNRSAKAKLILPRKFNEQKKMHTDTVIRHFSKTIKFFPIFHTQNIKPWNIDLVHQKLKLHNFDDILTQYQEIKSQMEENKMKKIIPIFFSSDDNYLPFLAVSIKSLLDNANKEYFYQINVLCDNLQEDGTQKILSLKTDNSSINFINMQSLLEPIIDKLKESLRDYYTTSIFYRIFIASLFPDLKKAIYLDCDIVVTGDISKLYEIDLQGNILGAVSDDIIASEDVFKEYASFGVGVKWQNYFNSGMLLIGLDEFRKHKVEEKFLELLKKYNFETVCPDQDYLNVLCKNKVLYLDKGWDKMSIDDDYQGMPNIIHYNMFYKPWLYDDVKYEKYFWNYAKETPFISKIMQIKSNYSAQDKQKDKQAHAMLIQRAREISLSQQNFSNTLKEVL